MFCQWHRQLCLVIWVNAIKVPFDIVSLQTATPANKCGLTHIWAEFETPIARWIRLHPSRSDWCPLHLPSARDLLHYRPGSRSLAQMGRVSNTTCSAFSNAVTANNKLKPTWVFYPIEEASFLSTLSDWSKGDLAESYKSHPIFPNEGQLA